MDLTKIIAIVLILILLVVIVFLYRKFKRGDKANPLAEKLAPYIDEEYYQREDERAAQEALSAGEQKNILERMGDVINNLNFLEAYQKKLGQKLSRAGIKLRSSEFILITFMVMTFFMVIGIVVSAIAGIRLLYGMVPFALVGYILPQIVVAVKKGARLKKFGAQLVDTLVLISNSLKAGYSFLQAVEMVAKESPPPTSEEFARVVRENSLGMPLDEALDALAGRMESKDLDLVVTAVLIQREVGGNLSEVLDSIAATIRERLKLFGQIKALTAQGKLGGIVIAALPFGLFFIMYLLKPDVMSELFKSPIGWAMIVIGIVMQSIGAFVISKIVNIEV